MNRDDLLALMKEYWPEDLADEAVAKNHPTIGMIRRDKDPEVVGKAIRLPIQWTKTPSRSRRFGTAQANATPSRYDNFSLQIVSDYGVGQLSGMAFDLAKQGNVGILVDEVIRSTKGSIETLGDQIGMDVFRNHGGARGVFSAIVGADNAPAATVYELEDITDIYFFEPDTVLEAAQTDGTSGALRAGTLTITKIDENTGRFTATGDITNLTAGDSFFGEGDFGLAPYGLPSWCPETVADNDDFCEVNRSTARARLAGVFLDADAEGWGLEEAFHMAKARERRGYAKAKFWVMNPLDLAGYETQFASTKRQIGDANDYGIGYDMITAYGADILYDPNCTLGETYGLAEGALKFFSLGEAPTMVDEDGLQLMRNGNANSKQDQDYYYEFRSKSRYNFGSPLPYGITRMRLPRRTG